MQGVKANNRWKFGLIIIGSAGIQTSISFWRNNVNEMATVYQFFGAVVGLAISCLLYMLGGRSGKWKRRFVGSFVLALTVNVLCLLRDQWATGMLAVWPLLILGYSMGYGGTVLKTKLIRRTLYAGTVLLSGLLMAFILGGNAWLVFGLHCGVAAFSVFMGVKNPVEASAEEGIICLLLSIGLISYPFIT